MKSAIENLLETGIGQLGLKLRGKMGAKDGAEEGKEKDGSKAGEGEEEHMGEEHMDVEHSGEEHMGASPMDDWHSLLSEDVGEAPQAFIAKPLDNVEMRESVPDLQSIADPEMLKDGVVEHPSR